LFISALRVEFTKGESESSYTKHTNITYCMLIKTRIKRSYTKQGRTL